MSFQAKRELLAQTGPRYHAAPPQQKRAILDEFVAATGYARKYAIRLLGQPVVPPPGPIVRPRVRQYGPAVVEALTVAWAAANYGYRWGLLRSGMLWADEGIEGGSMQCRRCAGEQFVKAGRDRSGRQIYQCATCDCRQTDRSTSAFCGYRFPDDIIALAVRWYLRFRLPYADIAELLAERGVHVDPSSVFDWVQRFTPLYKEAARPHRHRVGTRWAVDETYIRLAGRWVYAYRAIDEHGQVIDVYLSETRDTAAATAFFEQAIARTDVRPHRVTTDKAPTYPPALRAVVPEAEHITGKMEQQGIERDHQHLKGRTRSMRGFQQLRCAQVVCDGHGFMRNLRDGFYRLGEPTGDPRLPQAPRLMRAWDDLTQRLAAA